MGTKKKTFFHKLLNQVEVVGNKLPHPFMLFIYLAIFVILLSFVFSLFGLSAEDPTSGEEVAVQNLLSGEGFLFIFESMLENFTGFAPLGQILVLMLGIGLAQRVGLIETLIKTTIIKAPESIVTYVLIFIGVLANIASDAAMIIIPPLGAMIFYSLGRNPLAGMAAGFAGATAGFTANILIAGTDALLSGITTEVAQTVNPDIVVTPVDNWFFMSASVFLIVLVVGLVTNKITIPRLGEYDPQYAEDSVLEETADAPEKNEIRAMRNAVISGVLYMLLIVILLIPENSVLRGEGGTLVPSPFIDSIVPFVFMLFIVTALTYGISAGTIKKTSDVPAYMAESMKDMATFIVLVFAISQFLAYFDWTNMATVFAIHSSDFLQDIGFTGLGLFVAFIILTAVINQFLTSGSAQWALMSPVFVPLFMFLGYNPALTQLAYRIGDSSAAVLTPLNPYFVMVLNFMKRYDSRVGIGTLISLMIPYAFFVLTTWIIFFIIWVLLGLPIGPGVDIYL